MQVLVPPDLYSANFRAMAKPDLVRESPVVGLCTDPLLAEIGYDLRKSKLSQNLANWKDHSLSKSPDRL